MNQTLDLHTAGHSIGLWLFRETNAWFEFVLHTVLMAAPAALALLLLGWSLQRAGHVDRSEVIPILLKVVDPHATLDLPTCGLRVRAANG